MDKDKNINLILLDVNPVGQERQPFDSEPRLVSYFSANHCIGSWRMRTLQKNLGVGDIPSACCCRIDYCDAGELDLQPIHIIPK